MTPQQLRQSTSRGGEQRFQPVVIFDSHFVRLPYLFADCGDATDAARQAAADYQAKGHDPKSIGWNLVDERAQRFDGVTA